MFDDWVASMKHESYPLLSLIMGLTPLIKVGNSLRIEVSELVRTNIT